MGSLVKRRPPSRLGANSRQHLRVGWVWGTRIFPKTPARSRKQPKAAVERTTPHTWWQILQGRLGAQRCFLRPAPPARALLPAFDFFLPPYLRGRMQTPNPCTVLGKPVGCDSHIPHGGGGKSALLLKERGGRCEPLLPPTLAPGHPSPSPEHTPGWTNEEPWPWRRGPSRRSRLRPGPGPLRLWWEELRVNFCQEMVSNLPFD